MWHNYRADDDLGLSDEFLADECIARDEDNYGRPRRRCTCGYLDACGEYEDYARYGPPGCRPKLRDFAGCKGCDPVDHESKPYGWGIERFEREETLRRARQLQHWWPLTCELTWQRARELAFAWDGYDARLQRTSDRVWYALCECCSSHSEAVRRYGEWAARRWLSRRKN